VAAGHPVIVFQNLGLSFWHVWHYAVLTGYDLDKGYVVMHSGNDPDEVIGIELFERTWRRADNWSLVVLPPGQLPVAAQERDVLEAAGGLERVKDYSAAAKAYKAILARWPKDWAAYFGLGNVHFARAQYRAAEQAYRRALAIKPDEPNVWNNLAYALARQGHRSDALRAAHNAIAAATDKAPFERTLAELSSAAATP
jgi:tetratricopeptide (TPR) repeat protein